MVSIQEKDSAKIPIWMGNGKDQFTAEHWIKRLENAKASNSWTDNQTVNFAHSALRDKALLFRDYLEGERLNPNDWVSFRAHFLQQFGSTTVDHSKATNLVLTQKADERVNIFGWRVNTMVTEFFSSVPQNELNTSDASFVRLPDELLSGIPDEGQRGLVLRYVQQLSVTLHDSIVKGIKSSLGRVVFLNGLHPQIRMHAKLKDTVNLHDAVIAAMKVEKANNGPSEKVIQAVSDHLPQDLDDKEREANFVNKRKVRARVPSIPMANFRKKVNMECWYCHKKGHMQINCRLRLGRGAAMVLQPRTVQEIQYDRMAYQLEEDEGENEEEVEEATDGDELSAEVAALSLNHLN